MNFERMTFYRSLLDTFRKEIQLTLDYHIKNVMENVPNAIEAPLIIRFELNYKRLFMIEEMKMILDEILNESQQCVKDIREVAWIFISCLLGEKYPQFAIGIQLQQIHCVIRFSNLPLTGQYEFIPFQHPVRLSLSVMKCMLHSYGDRFQYVRQSIWYCPKQCVNNHNHIFDGEHGNDSNCLECNGKLSEYEVCLLWYSNENLTVFL